MTELRYLVQYAGLDTFRFEVPESVTGDVQIVSLESAPLPPIKQKVKADKAENGWVTWTITLQREVTGTYRFKVSYDLKPKVLGADDDAAKKDDEKPVAKKPADPNRPSLSVVQVARALGLDGSDAKKREVELSSVFGEVVVDKSRALAIETTKLDDGLEAIDVRELSLMPQSGAQAYRYYRQPAAVKVEARKYAIQEVVETVVMRSLVEVVTRKDVTASYRCRYWLKSSERQRLRIDLPVGSELLGVFVDGKQVSPEQNNEKRGDDEKAAWDSYFINVARTKPSDEPFSLTLQTSTPVGEAKRAPYESAQSSMTLRLPQVGGLGAGGIATQQMQVVVWAPSKFDLVGEPGKFVAESKLRLEDALFSRRYQPTDFFNVDQWVNVPGAGIIDFPTEGNRYRYSNLGGTDSIEITWVNRGYYTWLFSGALVVLGLLLRKVGWEQKLLLLLIGGFVAALVGLFYPGWIAEFFGMARYGLAVMLGTWVLQALFESRTTVSNVPASDPATPWSVDAVPAVVPPPGVFDEARRAFEK